MQNWHASCKTLSLPLSLSACEEKSKATVSRALHTRAGVPTLFCVGIYFSNEKLTEIYQVKNKYCIVFI